MPGPQGVPRADIIRLLAEGHSNRGIGRLLHTNPLRVGRIRKELGLPQAWRKQSITVEQKWATYTRPAGDGHLDWIGYRREGLTPMFMLRGVNYSARRVAFRIKHGREPQGRVLPGCDHPGCVAPACTTDAVMRRADAKYTAIFGRAA
jgi:hypothetical protein